MLTRRRRGRTAPRAPTPAISLLSVHPELRHPPRAPILCKMDVRVQHGVCAALSHRGTILSSAAATGEAKGRTTSALPNLARRGSTAAGGTAAAQGWPHPPGFGSGSAGVLDGGGCVPEGPVPVSSSSGTGMGPGGRR
jgi:hypothetical protein